MMVDEKTEIDTVTAKSLLGGFSDVDRSGPRDFVGRLDMMSALDFFQNYKEKTFALMKVVPGAQVADIGCGTGEDARRLASLVGSAGQVVGVDLSERMLAEARDRHGSVRNLSFERAGIENLGGAAERFDAIRIDRVLVHVEDPARAIKEALRVLRTGGRIVISEPDMASCWMTTDRPDIADAVMAAVGQTVAHPRVARDLYHLFLDLGIENVHLETRSLVITDSQPAERLLNLSLVAEGMVRNGLLSRPDVQEWAAEIDNRQKSGRFLGGMTVFIVAGQKRS